jgi:hypothetical protein
MAVVSKINLDVFRLIEIVAKGYGLIDNNSRLEYKSVLKYLLPCFVYSLST